MGDKGSRRGGGRSDPRKGRGVGSGKGGARGSKGPPPRNPAGSKKR